MSETYPLTLQRDGDATLTVRLRGTWQLGESLPSIAGIREQVLAPPGVRRVAFECGELARWDTSLLTFVSRLRDICQENELSVDVAGLPPGLRRMLELAGAVPEKEGARKGTGRAGILERTGNAAVAAWGGFTEMLAFLGEVTLGLLRVLRGRAGFRASDLWMLIQQAGAEALPIVTLISFLVGCIFAFVGAIQLQKFGAQIYVADLVGIAMVREMGAVMTGIIMAGRTGAAYAAQLGTMKVTQEIDAFTTLGISPIDFLVVPRVFALCAMMPLLCVYSDLMGVVGGAAVGSGILGISWTLYLEQTIKSLDLTNFAGGVFKALVYGGLVAFAGCLRGMQSGKSASAVGDAATSAVVTGIVLIIVACGTFSVVFYALGI